MSTRGLYGFIENRDYTANYNHSDSYPSGLGVEFLTACKNGDFSGFDIVEDSIDFIKDSLFCEWAYFYDRDHDIFEIWKGYQKFPDSTNPFGQETRNDYYPCKRIFRGHISSIDANDMKDNRDLESFLTSIHRDKQINRVLNDTNSR